MATVGQPAGPGAMRRITVHYTNSPTRNRTTADAADLGSLDDEFIHLVLGDVLQDQEGLHQSIMDGAYSNQNHMRRAGADHSQSEQHYHGESSTAAAATAAQIVSDLEYAKRLQEMEDLAIEDDDDISCVPSLSDTDSDDDDHDHNHNDEQALQDDRQNDDDPDNMTYEEREALGESVGSESRGLSDELISYLQPWKLKSSGFFSKKTTHDDCTICLNTFKHRDSLITLPCKHNYHKDCIATWLKLNKTCPVCKYEVFGPS